jgi:hypothetical protein
MIITYGRPFSCALRKACLMRCSSSAIASWYEARVGSRRPKCRSISSVFDKPKRLAVVNPITFFPLHCFSSISQREAQVVMARRTHRTVRARCSDYRSGRLGQGVPHLGTNMVQLSAAQGEHRGQQKHRNTKPSRVRLSVASTDEGLPQSDKKFIYREFCPCYPF